MDFLKSQRKIPRPRLAINTGYFRPTPQKHRDIPLNVQPEDVFYNTNNQFLPIDTVQKTITQHHFNQQITLSLPLPHSSITNPNLSIQSLNDMIYDVLGRTYVYHVQCSLGLLFTEPFCSTFFPNINTSTSQPTSKTKLTKSLYATSTWTDLTTNSFSIANQFIFFNLDKDTYHSLGLTAPHVITNSMYQFKIPINLATITRLRTQLSSPIINTIPFVIFAQEGGISVPMDWDLLFQAQHTQKFLQEKAIKAAGFIPMPVNTAPPLTAISPISPPPLLDTHITTTATTTTTTLLSTTDTTTSIKCPPLPFSIPLHTNPTLPPQTILSIKRLVYRFQSSVDGFTTIVQQGDENNNMTTKKSSSSSSVDMTRSSSPLFPPLNNQMMQDYIWSFFNHSTAKKTTKNPDDMSKDDHINNQCLTNLQNKFDQSVSLLSKVNEKYNKKAQNFSNKVKNSMAPDGQLNNISEFDCETDEDDDDDDDNDDDLDPKYVSYFVQKVRQKTQNPPSIPTKTYQVIAQQLQLYMSLIYSNNYNYFSNVLQKPRKDKGITSLNNDNNSNNNNNNNNKSSSDQGHFSYLSLTPSTNSTSSSSNSQGYTTFSIRGVLPPCVIVHIFKQMRAIVNELIQKDLTLATTTTTTPSSTGPISYPTQSTSANYGFMTVYGIPAAVCNYAERLHGHSGGFGGVGESNYTLLLTQNLYYSSPTQSDSTSNEMNDGDDVDDKGNTTTGNDKKEKSKGKKTPSSLCPDAFILFRNVDHSSQEF